MATKKKDLIAPIVFDNPVEETITNRLTRMQLAEIRKMNKATQQQLSAISGLSTQCISDIESNTSGNPTLKSLLRYLNVFGWEMCFQKKQEETM